MAQPQGMGRGIPDKLDDVGLLMARAGISARDIYKVFSVACMDGGQLPNFTYEDIYNKYKRVLAADRVNDACQLVEHLAARKATSNLEYFVELSGGRIDCIFVECDNAQQVWGTANVGNDDELHNVLMFDPTFGTNSFDMKMSMFVTVNGDGRTVVLAYMVHHEEDYKDVFWGFRCFHKVFRIPPATILTDSGAGILQAIGKMTLPSMPWCDTTPLLCIFHLDQNFYTNLHPLFNSNRDMWSTLHDMFWRLAKDPDTRRCDMLGAQMKEITQFIKSHGKGPSKEKALKWLSDVLFAKQHMWIACLTWKSFSAGAHATSRSEGLNGKIKSWMGENVPLLTLAHRMEQYNALKEHEGTCKYHADLLRIATQRGMVGNTVPPFIEETKSYLTPHAYQLVLAQLGMLFAYEVRPMPDDDERSDTKRLEPVGTNYLVTFRHQSDVGVQAPLRASDGHTASHNIKTDLGLMDVAYTHWVCLPGFQGGKPWCSCQYPSSSGIICRHQISVYYHKRPHGSGGTEVESIFAQRWMTRNKHFGARSLPGDSAVTPCPPTAQTSSQYDSTACYADAKAKMRMHGFQPRVLPVGKPFNIKDYHGTFMMLKYGARQQGGWHVAHMESHEEDDAMHLNFCFSDQTTAEWLCVPDNMAKLPLRPDRELAKKSWFLLQQAEPAQPTSGVDIRNPTCSRSNGPGQRKRKQNSHGPMSS